KSFIDGDFQLHLWQQSNLNFAAAKRLGVAALSSASVNVGYGHEIDLALAERILDRLESLRTDDGNDQFHMSNVLARLGAVTLRQRRRRGSSRRQRASRPPAPATRC